MVQRVLVALVVIILPVLLLALAAVLRVTELLVAREAMAVRGG